MAWCVVAVCITMRVVRCVHWTTAWIVRDLYYKAGCPKICIYVYINAIYDLQDEGGRSIDHFDTNPFYV
jgi:hypothetical protein